MKRPVSDQECEDHGLLKFTMKPASCIRNAYSCRKNLYESCVKKMHLKLRKAPRKTDQISVTKIFISTLFSNTLSSMKTIFVRLTLCSALTVVGIFGVLPGCTSEKSGSANGIHLRDGQNPNNSEKISGKIPPFYNSNLWSKGTYWVWRELKDPKVAKCIRWTIVDNTSAGGTTVEQKVTQDCTSYEGAKPAHFHFFPRTGEIDWSEISGQPGNVFGRLFGHDESITFYRSTRKLPSGKDLNVYQIEGNKSWYIDLPESTLRGVLWENDKLRLYEYSAK
jgi:hypothetical protein